MDIRLLNKLQKQVDSSTLAIIWVYSERPETNSSPLVELDYFFNGLLSQTLCASDEKSFISSQSYGTGFFFIGIAAIKNNSASTQEMLALLPEIESKKKILYFGEIGKIPKIGKFEWVQLEL